MKRKTLAGCIVTRDTHWGSHPCLNIHTHTHTRSHLGHPHGNTWKRDRKRGRGANWSTKSKANLVNIQMHRGRLSQLLLPPKKQMHQVRHCASTSTHSPSFLSSFLLLLLFFSQLSLPALYLISFLRLHPLSSKNFAISYRSSPSLLFNFLSSSPLVFSSICSRHPISRINLGTVHFCKTTDVEALHLRCNFRFL